MAQNAAASGGYASFVTFVSNCMAILKQSDVRKYFRFGRRMRDPVVDFQGVDSEVTLPLGLSGAPLVYTWLTYGTSQPLVYASAFVRQDLAGM